MTRSNFYFFILGICTTDAADIDANDINDADDDVADVADGDDDHKICLKASMSLHANAISVQVV